MHLEEQQIEGDISAKGKFMFDILREFKERAVSLAMTLIDE